MNTNLENTTTAASATTPVDSVKGSGPAARAGGRDLLLLVIETCLDAHVEANFFRLLTADDLVNLRSLSGAWRASAKLAWALDGPGRRHVRHRCELPPGCPFRATTRASQLEWCAAHEAVWGMRAIAVCPRHRAPLAPGAAVRGLAGPMCTACHLRLADRSYLEWLGARRARMSPAVRALTDGDRAEIEASGVRSEGREEEEESEGE